MSHTCWGFLVKNENRALQSRRMFTGGARSHHMEQGVAQILLRLREQIMERRRITDVCGSVGEDGMVVG